MMNYIADLLLSFLLNNPLRDPKAAWAQTPPIQASARFLQLLPPSRFNVGDLISFVIAIVVAVILYRTTLGYEIRMMGFNRRFAKSGGINVPKTILLAMILSGALAGLAGVIEIMGVHQMVLLGFSNNFGWDGIPVALIAQLNPIAVIPAAIFMAILRVGSTIMNMQENIPIDLVRIVIAVILMLITAEGIYKVFKIFRIRYRKNPKNEPNI